MATPSGEQFELAFGDQRAVVVEIGGGLRSYAAGGRDVLDGYAEQRMCDAGRGQVLAPWPNRLEDGSYEFDGRRHQLPLTEVPNRNAIHGLVRWSACTVDGARRRPRRDGAPAASAAGLPVHARPARRRTRSARTA